MSTQPTDRGATAPGPALDLTPAPATKRGRPAAKDLAPDGMSARVRLLWHDSGCAVPALDGPKVELFSGEVGALRLLAAWARNNCTPADLRIERKGVAGWVAV